MNRSLTAGLLGATLILAACNDAKPTASRSSPDQYTRAGCVRVAELVERNDRSWLRNGSWAARAAESTDPAVRAAGRELVLVTNDAGRLTLNGNSNVDMTQAEARIADAQQILMAACRELLGEPPWPST